MGKQQIKVPSLARWAKDAAAKLGSMADVVKVVVDAGGKLLPDAQVTTAAVGRVHTLLAWLPKRLKPGAEDLRALQAELHSVQVLVFIDDLDRIENGGSLINSFACFAIGVGCLAEDRVRLPRPWQANGKPQIPVLLPRRRAHPSA
ncbi:MULTISPECIES: hypothetical protein [Pseudomonas]|uniref:hypothetical protein n=1 Tax=Pseudomonas TaxID=286 RepID=UPI0005798AD7|nr:hypothetical protein [Pseudomonas putida]